MFGGFDPLAPLRVLQREVERALSLPLRAAAGLAAGLLRGWSSDAPGHPPMCVLETDDDIVVAARIPGVRPEAVEVTLTGTTLTLRGVKPAPEIPPDAVVLYKGRKFGEFVRSVPLPGPVLPATADAFARDGLFVFRVRRAPAHEAKAVAVGSPGSQSVDIGPGADSMPATVASAASAAGNAGATSVSAPAPQGAATTFPVSGPSGVGPAGISISGSTERPGESKSATAPGSSKDVEGAVIVAGGAVIVAGGAGLPADASSITRRPMPPAPIPVRTAEG